MKFDSTIWARIYLHTHISIDETTVKVENEIVKKWKKKKKYVKIPREVINHVAEGRNVTWVREKRRCGQQTLQTIYIHINISVYILVCVGVDFSCTYMRIINLYLQNFSIYEEEYISIYSYRYTHTIVLFNRGSSPQ